jgi:hypothetical protein
MVQSIRVMRIVYISLKCCVSSDSLHLLSHRPRVIILFTGNGILSKTQIIQDNVVHKFLNKIYRFYELNMYR